MADEALRVFFSYSHKDEALRDALGNHLKILEYQKMVSSWHDRRILPGDEWDHQINANLESADIILLLISSDFIASKYCWEIEITRAMELHEAGKACVIPVILRPVNWAIAPFGKLQALPKNAEPVESNAWFSRDEAFNNITQGIQAAAQRLIEQRQQQQHTQQKAAAIAEYRQHYQAFLTTNGEISSGEQFILKDLQKKQGLTDDEVKAIAAEFVSVVNSEQVQSYRQAFMDAVQQHGYPLGDLAKADLKLVQNYLGLSDADVSQLEASTMNLATEPEGQATSTIAAVQAAEGPAIQQSNTMAKSDGTANSAPAIALALDELKSDKAMDYAPLRDLLHAHHWEAADRETHRLFLLLVGRKEGSWITGAKELQMIPCTDLRTIDRLWSHYSDGRFGFSVQQQIWEETGDWVLFGDRIGWRAYKTWLAYSELTFDRAANVGHLPAKVIFASANNRLGGVFGYVGWLILALMTRIKTCGL
jgi:GUN4-like/TIR domain